MNYQNRQWFYVKRPEGRVGDEHYELRESELDDNLSSNEVLIRARIVSVDPYIRIQQHERNTYDVPHPLGHRPAGGRGGRSGGVGEPAFQAGRLGVGL